MKVSPADTRDVLRVGRMISFNKTCPKGHVCVFNANICVKSKGKIWHGDLDLTADAKALKEFAKNAGETIHILREMDARFHTEDNPQYENAVASIEPDGTVFIQGVQQ